MGNQAMETNRHLIADHSFRTLLIATTLVAVVLGLIVYAAHR
jgi:hypothetical protein